MKIFAAVVVGVQNRAVCVLISVEARERHAFEVGQKLVDFLVTRVVVDVPACDRAFVSVDERQ